MIEIEDAIKIWKDAIGSFVIIDYKTINDIDTAKGKLESISNNGEICVRHINNPRVFWTFNISQVKNSKFSPIKSGVHNDANSAP